MNFNRNRPRISFCLQTLKNKDKELFCIRLGGKMRSKAATKDDFPNKQSIICKKLLPLLEHTRVGIPIIQNGHLVGAVTHILINDPTSGYGIFIENMLKQMGEMAG